MGWHGKVEIVDLLNSFCLTNSKMSTNIPYLSMRFHEMQELNESEVETARLLYG